MRLTRTAAHVFAATLVLTVALCLVGCAEKEAPPAATEEAAPAPETEATITLTADMIDQWLVSVADPKVKEILASLKPEGKIVMAETAANADKAGADEELDAVVKGMGYTDAAEWAAVTKRVYAGLIPMQIEIVQAHLKTKLDDPAEVEDMMEQTNAKMEEAKTAFGELSDEEMRIFNDAAEKIAGAMG